MFQDFSSSKGNFFAPEKRKTKATWLFAIHQALKNEGFDADGLFKSRNITLSSFKNSLAPVPTDVVNQIWQDAVQLTQNDAFGLSLIKFFNLPYLNALASLAQASQNIEQALKALEKFHSLVSDNVAIEVSCTHQIKIRIMNKNAPDTWFPDDIEIAFALILQYGASLPVQEIKPLGLTLTRKQPDNIEHYQRVFNCPIEFSAVEAAIYFSKDALHYPIPSANGTLFSQFEQLLNERLPKPQRAGNISSLKCRTMLYLKSLPLKSIPCLQETAANFCMSSSCFKKHLQTEDSSFQQLADHVRKERALELLAKPEMSLKEVAYHLGFANSSAFNRAFKRWTNENPKEYRETRFKVPAPISTV